MKEKRRRPRLRRWTRRVILAAMAEFLSLTRLGRPPLPPLGRTYRA